MKYHEYAPHPSLQDTVKCLWIHEAAYPSETKQDITPDGCVELIFNFGDPYRLLTTAPPTPLPPAIIVGFQNKTMPILLHGSVKVALVVDMDLAVRQVKDRRVGGGLLGRRLEE